MRLLAEGASLMNRRQTHGPHHLSLGLSLRLSLRLRLSLGLSLSRSRSLRLIASAL